MLVKGLLRFLSSINLRFNRKSFSVINSSGYQSRFYFRNIPASANIREPGKNYWASNLEEVTFRKYIEKNNNFKSPVLEIINLNFPLEKPESLKLLVKLKENVEDDRLWQEMLDCFKREVGTFDVEDFLKIIALAADLKINKDSQNLEDFIICLDSELRGRTFEMNDVLEILYVLKHTLFMGKSLKRLRFYFKIFRLMNKLHKYEPLQAAHIFYYLEKINDSASTECKYPLLQYAKKNITQLNLYEMGIILAGLYRAKLFSSDVTFIQQIIDKVCDEIETVNSIHLFYVSKFLSNCSSISNHNIIVDFQGKLIPHISRFNSSSLTSALLLCYPISLNMSFWNNVVERLKPELKTLYTVDIERMTSITAAFRVENKDEFLKLAIEAVEEGENIDYYSTHFISFCKYLAMHRVYPQKLLDIALSKDFIENMVTRSFLKPISSWLFLNGSLQIDKPECQYKDLKIDEVLKKKIMKAIYFNVQKDDLCISSSKSRFMLRRHLQAVFGDSAVVETYCIPHLGKGLVMRFDEDLNATVVPPDSQLGSKELVHAPLDQHFWICLNVTFISPEGLSPFQETYKRHLSACGYIPILVDSGDFYYYRKKEPEKLKEYLKGFIQKALEETLKEKQEQKY